MSTKDFDPITVKAWKRFFNKWKKKHPRGFSGVELEDAKFEFWQQYESKPKPRARQKI